MLPVLGVRFHRAKICGFFPESLTKQKALVLKLKV